MTTVTSKLLSFIDDFEKNSLEEMLFGNEKENQKLLVYSILAKIRKKLIENVPYEMVIYRSIFDDAQDTYQNTNGEWLFTVESFSDYLRSRFEIYKIKDKNVTSDGEEFDQIPFGD